MREDAARVMWADDYEFLRERARAHLAEANTPAAPSRASRNVRVISSNPVPTRADAHPPEPTTRRPGPAPARVPAPRSYGSRRGPAPRTEPRRHEPAPRRTVPVNGQRPAAARRRPPAIARVAAEPDRIALWAVVLGVFLVLVAVATAHA